LIAVDSNMWIYYLDPTTEEHKLFRDELDRIIKTEEILTNTIIWMEVAHYLYKVSRLPRERLEQRIRSLTLLSTMTVVAFDLEQYYRSLKILSEMRNYPIGGRDATILAAMQEKNVKRILTHNEGFKRLAEHHLLEVVDPLQEPAPS